MAEESKRKTPATQQCTHCQLLYLSLTSWRIVTYGAALAGKHNHNQQPLTELLDRAPLRGMGGCRKDAIWISFELYKQTAGQIRWFQERTQLVGVNLEN